MRKIMSRVSLLIATTGCFLLLLQFAGYAETVSEEARRHMARGEAAMEMAKSPDEYDTAIKEFKDAARLAPGWPEPHRNLALLQEKMGKIKEAVSSLKEYLRLAPSAPDASKVREHIYKLEYKVEQTLTIPEIIDVLVSLSDKQKWDVTGDCDTYTTFFSRDKGQWALGRKEILSRTSNEVYARVAGGYSPTTDVAYEVNGPILKYIFNADKYPPGQCAVPSDCCDDECITSELREAEVVSGTLVRITQKVMKNVPRGRPEDGEVKEVLSCTYKAKAGSGKVSGKPPITDVNARDKDGHTALDNAILEGKKETVEELIAKGADINAKAKYGYTPLCNAVISTKKEMVELIMAKGADINAKCGTDGYTPLISAVVTYQTEIFKLLIDKGADVNARDMSEYTPLDHAVINFGWEEAELLIANGADVSPKNKYGNTPLHSAACKKNSALVELLIAKGADINAKNNDGETPLRIAMRLGNSNIVELLKKHGAKE